MRLIDADELITTILTNDLCGDDNVDKAILNAPTVKAIPIKWINSYTTALIFSDDYVDNAEGIDDYIYCIKEMVRDWEKENDLVV